MSACINPAFRDRQTYVALLPGDVEDPAPVYEAQARDVTPNARPTRDRDTWPYASHWRFRWPSQPWPLCLAICACALFFAWLAWR